MKRNCLVLIFLFMLLLTASAFALTADVTMKTNGGMLPDLSGPADAQMWVGNDNILEIWVMNSAKLKGFSLGFQFSNDGLPYSLVSPYGNQPAGSEILQEHGTVNNFLYTFGDGNLGVTFGAPADVLFLGGADASPTQGKNLYAHLVSTLGYSVKVNIPSGQADGEFCVMPVFVPPAGDWLMDASVNLDSITGLPSGAVAPNFQGNPPALADPGDGHMWPTCPPACFKRGLKPCEVPTFTTTPTLPVSASHGGYSFDFNATVGEVPPLSWGTTVGEITSAGVLTVAGECPPATTPVTVSAINGCAAPKNHTDFSFTITWTNTPPVITNCPGVGEVVGQVAATTTFGFTATDVDAGDDASLTWGVTSLDADGTFDIVPATGVFTYTPTAAGVDHFIVTATDMCGGVGTCEFSLEVFAIQANIVQIAKTGEDPLVIQGTYTWVPVTMGQTQERYAGFNLLIHYDASALSFVSAKLGDALAPCDEGGSGWEYFAYRFGDDGNCSGSCPSGLLRVVALAETNNGANHPGCLGTKDPYDLKNQVITYLKFYVTNDRTYECMYSEIGFAWIDCGDNTFSDTSGNQLYVTAAGGVHTFEWDKWTLYDATYIPCEEYPNLIGVLYGGFCPGECANIDPQKPQPLELLYFMNGGVDIACADSIDARGDVNLNGVANEIADAVLFTNYFLRGLAAFTINVAGQVAATDINNDGHVLQVGDLVYLLRVIVGDALPFSKLAPFAGSATVDFANGVVSTQSGSEIGGVYATFSVNGAYSVVSNTNMQVESAESNGELKVLVYSGLTNLSNRIAAGSNELFTVSGNVELKSVEVADYYGNMMNTRVSKTALPTSFALSQNVPNPFNPTTKIGFALPNQTQWTLNIYNVAGQLVKNFSGNNIGNVTVEWDASMVPSGVYFYKLNAGSYSDTKKMVLMK